MTYHINTIYKTLQGEGYWTGRAAVFCRFSRCNLWTGREKDRHRAVCKFCDTDFTSSNPYESVFDLGAKIAEVWGIDYDGNTWDVATHRLVSREAMVVLTGGEPLLQADEKFIVELHRLGFYVAVETNGTIKRPAGINWLTVSPKVNAELIIHQGDELKLVYPQGPDPSVYLGMNFSHYWLSPMDGPNLKDNTVAAIDYVKDHPKWRLSVQTHKYVGID